MNKIIPSFQESLFDGSKDFLEDIVEVGIDSVLEEGLLKELPIVGFLVGTKNVVQNLRDRNLLNQTLQFIKEFNSGNIDMRKLAKYKELISNDSDKAEKELGRVLLILNQTIDIEKSKILANFYRNYINEKITWQDFCDFSFILNNLFLSDLPFLCDIYNTKITETLNQPIHSINRLKSLGIIDTSQKGGMSFESKRTYSPDNDDIGITQLGKLFLESMGNQ